MSPECAFHMGSMCVQWDTAGWLAYVVGLVFAALAIGVLYLVTEAIDRRRGL